MTFTNVIFKYFYKAISYIYLSRYKNDLVLEIFKNERK